MTQSRSRGKRRGATSRRRPPADSVAVAKRSQRGGTTSQDIDREHGRRTGKATSVPSGYRLEVIREDGRTVARKLEPIEPLPSQLYGALHRELRGWVRHMVPSPKEYKTWYEKRRVGSLRQAVWWESRFCSHCGAEIVDKRTGQGLLDPLLTRSRVTQRYCSPACRGQARSHRYRARNPDHKLKR
jgi:hypothetical protein